MQKSVVIHGNFAIDLKKSSTKAFP